jgi:hypothetical protein
MALDPNVFGSIATPTNPGAGLALYGAVTAQESLGNTQATQQRGQALSNLYQTQAGTQNTAAASGSFGGGEYQMNHELNVKSYNQGIWDINSKLANANSQLVANGVSTLIGL